jgi:hypothetical protein
MLNYEAVVTCEALLLARPLCVVGRGMGALAAMMAAQRVEPDALVLVEPWPPAEVKGSAAVAVEGSARPESELAVSECRRGISVPSLPAPALVAGGSALAAFYGAEDAAGASPEAAVAWARSVSASAT